MSAKLKDIAAVIDGASLKGDPEAVVLEVTHDSRRVAPGGMFAALPGTQVDGHDFIDRAVLAGASAVMAERPPSASHVETPWITVPDSRKALGPVAALVHGDPTKKLTLVGITGTNGKTTLTYLLESIIKASGGVPGVVGTITYRWGDVTQSAERTTPEASDLQSIFARMLEAGVTHALVEVSSHGLELGRLDGCRFDIGVFANLTQDHLDFHHSMEDYYRAKRRLFTELLPASGKATARAAINLDDPYGKRLSREIGRVPVIGYGFSDECAVRPERSDISAAGIVSEVASPHGPIQVRSRLTGRFNLVNIMAAIAVADGLGIEREAIEKGIEASVAAPGRLERVAADRNIFVDYAHTPDALKTVIMALKGVTPGRLITIMGCGGDRDRAKRPLMGREAALGSDFVVVTSDNPRSEDPMAIIEDVSAGLEEVGRRLVGDSLNGDVMPSQGYRIFPDRRQAISWTVANLEPDDVLLVAGKGHETYQEVAGKRHPFDDREVVREELSKLRAKD